jgi:hypothetical protein
MGVNPSYSGGGVRRRPVAKIAIPYLKNKLKVKRLGCGSSGRIQTQLLQKKKKKWCREHQHHLGIVKNANE